MENDIPCLIITLMNSTGSSVKENIKNVSEFEVIIASNYSKADLSYKTIQGDTKKIELK